MDTVIRYVFAVQQYRADDVYFGVKNILGGSLVVLEHSVKISQYIQEYVEPPDECMDARVQIHPTPAHFAITVLNVVWKLKKPAINKTKFTGKARSVNLGHAAHFFSTGTVHYTHSRSTSIRGYNVPGTVVCFKKSSGIQNQYK